MKLLQTRGVRAALFALGCFCLVGTAPLASAPGKPFSVQRNSNPGGLNPTNSGKLNDDRVYVVELLILDAPTSHHLERAVTGVGETPLAEYACYATCAEQGVADGPGATGTEVAVDQLLAQVQDLVLDGGGGSARAALTC